MALFESTYKCTDATMTNYINTSNATATATVNTIRRHKRSQSMLNIHSASDNKAASTMSFSKRKMSCHKRSQSQLTMSMSKTFKSGCTSPTLTPTGSMSLATLLRSFPETLMMAPEATTAAAATTTTAPNSLVVTPCQSPTKRPRLSSASEDDDIGSVSAVLQSPPRLRPRQRTTLVLVPSTSEGTSEAQSQTQPRQTRPNVDLMIPTLDDGEESPLPHIQLQPRQDRACSVVLSDPALFLPFENDNNNNGVPTNSTRMEEEDYHADAEVASLTTPLRTRSGIWRLTPRSTATTSSTNRIRLSQKDERDLWFLL